MRTIGKKPSALTLVIVTLLALWMTTGRVASQGTISPAPFLTELNNSGQIVSNGCIWTTIAGTSTPLATYTDVGLSVPNTNPIRTDSAGRFTAFLIPGQSYKLSFESSCSPPSHGTIFRTADNINTVPGSATTTDVTGTAGETITAGQCAYLSDGSGGKNAGQWYKCDTANTYSSISPAVGVLPSSISSGSTGTIRLAGLVTGLSGLTAGAAHYVASSGAISTTIVANTRIVGIAHSTTALLVTANPPLLNFGNINVNTNKFTVTASTGDTSIAGVLGVTGNLSVNTNKFVVTAASGNTSIGGTIAASQSSGSLVRHTFLNTNVGGIQTDLQIGQGTGTNDMFFGVNNGGANAYLDNRSGGSLFFKSNLTLMTLTTAGALSLNQTAGTITERNRSFAMGASQDQAYNGADYSTTGGGTWTVDSGDMTSNKYSIVGDTLSWRVAIDTSTFATTPGTITVKLPNSYTAQENCKVMVQVIIGGAGNGGMGTATAGTTTIAITPIGGGTFANGTNNVTVFFQITLKVS